MNLAKQLDDRELYQRHLSGDPDALSLLYDQWAPMLFLYAQSQTRSRELAEDLLQETFLRLMRYREPLQTTVRALLITILRNLIRDQARSRVRRQETFPSLRPSPSSSLSLGDLDALSEALGRLSSEQKEIVILKTYADLSFSAIADLLGIPTATAKSRYRYALEKLARELSYE